MEHANDEARAALTLVCREHDSSILAAAPAPPRSKPRSKPAPAPSRDAPKAKDNAPAATPIVHEVNKGESLSGIARKYKVTVASLVIANRLRGPRATLAPGLKLRIPPAGPTSAPLRPRRAPVDEPLPVSLVLGVPDRTSAELQWPSRDSDVPSDGAGGAGIEGSKSAPTSARRCRRGDRS